jgi:hypothetical protein
MNRTDTTFMGQRRHALIALCSLALLPTARAAEAPVLVEGQSFERQLRLLGSDLLLNGTGVRSVAWFKAFAVGLYLTGSATTAEQALAMPGAKRLRMRMLTDAPASAFAQAFRKGLARNVSGPGALAALESRMAGFEESINGLGKVRKGDVIDLDLDPVRGTLFAVNGTLRHGPIAGDDFYSALLRAFIGEQPYDEKLRAGLLGQAA